MGKIAEVTGSLIVARLLQRLEDVEDNVANINDRHARSVCQVESVSGAEYAGTVSNSEGIEGDHHLAISAMTSTTESHTWAYTFTTYNSTAPFSLQRLCGTEPNKEPSDNTTYP